MASTYTIDLSAGGETGDSAIQKVSDIFSQLGTHAANLSSISLSSTVEVDPSPLGMVIVPETDWDDISITGALAYWSDVTSNALGLPNYVAVPYPTPPSFTIPEDAPEYDDSLRAALSTSIVSDLNDGGYGIKSENEGMEFEAERDHLNDEMLEAMSVSAARMASGGFGRIPGSIVRSMFMASHRTNNELSKQNGKIVVEANDRYSKAKSATYVSGVELAKVAFDNYSLALRTAAEVYKAKMEGFFQEIRSTSLLASSEYDAYKSVTDAFSAEMDGLYRGYEALSNVREFSYGKYNSEVFQAIEENKAILDGVVEELKAFVGVGSVKVKAYASMAAAALSGMDVNASQRDAMNHETSIGSSSTDAYKEASNKINQYSEEGIVSEEADSGGSWNWQ